ncbi:MAG: DKNYY domain-containing protein [Acidobacteria bacterium]|nr:DKNYY domain-containing protein [Acidobacteriota bacterium]
MTSPRIGLLLSALVPWLLGGCGPSESATGYEVRGNAVYWVDRETPDAMKGGYGGLVYQRRERGIPEADARTFQVLPVFGYAKDAKHVFFEGRMLEGSQAATFQLMAKGAWARDARQVYSGGAVIPGADPATFEPLGKGLVARDKHDYYWGVTPLHVRDVKAFTVVRPDADSADILEIWGYDAHGYYAREEMTPIADGATFQFLGYHYAKDAKQVYFQQGILTEADQKTFQFVGGESAKDARRVYWHDFVLEGADPRTFQLMTYNYTRDAKQVYHLNEVIPGADAPTFQVIGPSTKGFGYGKDAKRVYYAASVIEGADPATFAVDKSDPELASDKNGRFQYGRRIEK